MLGPTSAAMVMARIRAGNAIIRSVDRITMLPTTPRRNPAVNPIRVPANRAIPFATNPTSSEVRAP